MVVVWPRSADRLSWDARPPRRTVGGRGDCWLGSRSQEGCEEEVCTGTPSWALPAGVTVGRVKPHEGPRAEGEPVVCEGDSGGDAGRRHSRSTFSHRGPNELARATLGGPPDGLYVLVVLMLGAAGRGWDPWEPVALCATVSQGGNSVPCGACGPTANPWFWGLARVGGGVTSGSLWLQYVGWGKLPSQSGPWPNSGPCGGGDPVGPRLPVGVG